VARRHAKEMGMEVHQMEPIHCLAADQPPLLVRWLQGLELSIGAIILLAIAFQLPVFLGETLLDGPNTPEGLKTTLGVVWAVAMIIICPLAFHRMARMFFASTLGGRG
jgi:hypothetical protein